MTSNSGSKESAYAGPPTSWDSASLEQFACSLVQFPALLQAEGSFAFPRSWSEEGRTALKALGAAIGKPELSLFQLHKRIRQFKRFFLKKLKLRFLNARMRGSKQTRLLKGPSWIRIMEAELRSSPEVKRIHSEVAARTATEQEVEAWGAWGAKGEARAGAGVAAVLHALTSRAVAARSLAARAVCAPLPTAPHVSPHDLQHVWSRMQACVRQKLSTLAACGDSEAALGRGGRLRAHEWRLLDALLLHDAALRVVTEEHVRRLEPLQALVALFHLVQFFQLEAPPPAPPAPGWHAAYAAYKRRGLSASIVLLQRRWHELKLQTARLVAAAARPAPAAAPAPPPAAPAPPPRPCALHLAVARRYPHVVTARPAAWRELVAARAVVEEYSPAAEAAAAVDVQDFSSRVTVVSPTSLAQGHYKDDEDDDLILIEQQIETVDLMNLPDDELAELVLLPPATPPAPSAPTAPTAPDAPTTPTAPIKREKTDDAMDLRETLQNRRQDMARALEEELDRQLRDLEEYEPDCDPPRPPFATLTPRIVKTETVSDSAIGLKLETVSDSDNETVNNMHSAVPVGPCRKRSREHSAGGASDASGVSGASVVSRASGGSEGSRASGVSEVSRASGVSEVSRASVQSGDADPKDEESTIDPKLFMNTEVRLVRVDEDGGWRAPPPRRELPPRLAKRARLAPHAPPTRRPASPVAASDTVPIDESGDQNQVETVDARDGHTRGAEGGGGRKRVQLPDIAEVRRLNRCILTAQVAPLSAPLPPASPPSRRSSSESTELLYIDEEAAEHNSETEAEAEAGPALSAAELEAVLARLAAESSRSGAPRSGAAAAYCCPARRHRAINDARRRNAARAGRAAPADVELHRGKCAGQREGRGCSCCCAHLLDAAGAAAALGAAADRLHADIARLLASPTQGADVSEEAEKNKTGPKNKKSKATKVPAPAKKCKSKRKVDPLPGDAGEEVEGSAEGASGGDPMQEWIRQKNITSRFFNLNLKSPALRPVPRPERPAPRPVRPAPRLVRPAAPPTAVPPPSRARVEPSPDTRDPARGQGNIRVKSNLYRLTVDKNDSTLNESALFQASASAAVPAPLAPAPLAPAPLAPASAAETVLKQLLLDDINKPTSSLSATSPVNPVTLKLNQCDSLPPGAIPIRLLPMVGGRPLCLVPASSAPAAPTPSAVPTATAAPTLPTAPAAPTASDDVVDLCDDTDDDARSSSPPCSHSRARWRRGRYRPTPTSPPPRFPTPLPPPVRIRSTIEDKNKDILVRLPPGISVQRKPAPAPAPVLLNERIARAVPAPTLALAPAAAPPPAARDAPALSRHTFEVSPMERGRSSIKVFKISEDGRLTPYQVSNIKSTAAKFASPRPSLLSLPTSPPRGSLAPTRPPRPVSRPAARPAVRPTPSPRDPTAANINVSPEGLLNVNKISKIVIVPHSKMGELIAKGNPRSLLKLTRGPPLSPGGSRPVLLNSLLPGAAPAAPNAPFDGLRGLNKIEEIQTPGGPRVLVMRRGELLTSPVAPDAKSSSLTLAWKRKPTATTTAASEAAPSSLASPASQPSPSSLASPASQPSPSSLTSPVTQASPVSQTSPASQASPALPTFGSSEPALGVAQWAAGRDRAALLAHCCDLAEPYYSPLKGKYYVVCERELDMASPSYWTTGEARDRCRRLAVSAVPAPVAPSPAPALAPAERCVYRRLSVDPVVDAKVWFVVRGAGECARLVARGGALAVVCAATGVRAVLRVLRAPRRRLLALRCDFLDAAQEITQDLKKLSVDTPEPRHAPRFYTALPALPTHSTPGRAARPAPPERPAARPAPPERPAARPAPTARPEGHKFVRIAPKPAGYVVLASLAAHGKAAREARASETQPRASETQPRASETQPRASETQPRASETEPRAPRPSRRAALSARAKLNHLMTEDAEAASGAGAEGGDYWVVGGAGEGDDGDDDDDYTADPADN